MAKTAFLFPGQGAQYIGMGREIYEHYPAARDVFDQAAQVLGDELMQIIFSGPDEILQKTEYTQPAILTTSIAIYRVMEQSGCRARGMAGLSLGEYSALVASGALSFADALPLVRKRGRLMQEAVPLHVGAMAAIMGLGREDVEAACLQAAASAEGVVAPANYNCPGQVVISGRADAVRRAVELAREAGAKKVVDLKVSAPFHCSLLAPVEETLESELAQVNFQPPSVPVVFNVSADFHTDPGQIKRLLVRQVSSPILWEQSINVLLGAGFDTFVELGPGKTLTRLMKKIDPAVYAANVEDCPSLAAALDYLKGVVE